MRGLIKYKTLTQVVDGHSGHPLMLPLRRGPATAKVDVTAYTRRQRRLIEASP